ncbi:hypothetical protein ACRN97_04285 [Shewanella baltica]|uniref:hypothetical protein n=1 Tax=Shewanella baltica TaxID=62322 RepID=UPI003D7B480A
MFSMRKIILPLIMLSLGALPLFTQAQDTSALWGKKYAEVKSSLLAAGWVLAPVAEDETPMTEAYPEITCGNGAIKDRTGRSLLEQQYPFEIHNQHQNHRS